MNRSTQSALTLLLTLAGVGAHAEINPIPKQSGFSGFGQLGASYNEVNSNVLIGPEQGESERLDSLNGQTGSSGGRPDLNLDLRYTFAESRTQLFLGNVIQDALMLDFTQQFGVRQQMGNKGIGSVAYVFSGIPGEVWRDPYQTGSARDDTDRTSSGGRLGWDGIWGSPVSATYTYRSIEIDQEHSGESIAWLTDAERGELDRNGDSHELGLTYNWRLENGSQLTPGLTYRRYAADGEATSYDRFGGQLTYALMQRKYSLITNMLVNRVEYDGVNPVFGRTVEADEWALNATFMWHQLFGVDPLSGLVSASYGESDANVDFFDADLSQISAGLLYRF